jgi:hypothetical protein
MVLALVAYQLRGQFRVRRRENTLANAKAAGIEFDAAGNVLASATYASLSENEDLSGKRLSGKQAEFMELTRLIASGPEKPDEIRFLLHKGFEPIVRPDGLVYVPCVENEHMFMEGEIPLVEEDLAILEE